MNRSTLTAGASEGPSSQTVIRVDPATVLMFAILFAPSLLFGLMLFVKAHDDAHAAFFCGLYFVMVYWMCGRQVELAPNQVIHRAFFVRKQVELTTLTSIAMEVRPAPTLVFRTTGDKPVSFTAKPFSEAGIAAILQHAQSANPAVVLEHSLVGWGQRSTEPLACDNRRSRTRLAVVYGIAGLLTVVTAGLRAAHRI